MSSTRRGFLGGAVGAAAAALSTPFAARAQTTTTPTPAPPPAATPTPPPDPKAQALAKLARERYGKFLSPEEGTLLDERCAAIERRSARLRAAKLDNGDEPAAEFRARL